MTARVEVGQIVMSVRSKTANLKHLLEAMRRSKMKFPGQQVAYVSRKLGFTPYTPEQFAKLKAEGLIVPDGGCAVKRISQHGRLRRYVDNRAKWGARGKR